MNTGQMYYRIHQFFNGLFAYVNSKDLENVSEILSPAQMALFNSMSTADQAHSIRVFNSLLQQQEQNPELLSAALLHDVGKSRYTLRLWERALIVVMSKLFPLQTKKWDADSPIGWKRPFIIAEQHPIWGAEMVDNAGASQLVINLIRRHQDYDRGMSGNVEDKLLDKLQAVDNDS